MKKNSNSFDHFIGQPEQSLTVSQAQTFSKLSNSRSLKSGPMNWSNDWTPIGIVRESN